MHVRGFTTDLQLFVSSRFFHLASVDESICVALEQPLDSLIIRGRSLVGLPEQACGSSPLFVRKGQGVG